jgi:hypothetical protein
MDNHDQRSALQPLLIKFARPQRAADVAYRYDEAKGLNVTVADGVPVVDATGGRLMVKTQAVAEED